MKEKEINDFCDVVTSEDETKIKEVEKVKDAIENLTLNIEYTPRDSLDIDSILDIQKKISEIEKIMENTNFTTYSKFLDIKKLLNNEIVKKIKNK